MRVAIYLRQSRDRRESVSIEVQQQACQEYADRMGWTITEVYIDRGESGSTARSAQRPQYRAMLDAADTWDVMLVWRLDRNGRHELEFHRMLADIEERGKTFAAATEDVDDPLVRSIKIAIAADFSRKLGQTVAAARRTKAHRGLWPSAAPWGTLKDGEVLKPDPDRTPLIHEALRRLAGGQTLAQVIRWLNTGPLAHEPISRSLLVKWTSSPMLRGEVRWRGEIIPAQWDPIVDPQLQHEAARQVTERYRLRPRVHPTRDYSSVMWVRGLERCGYCGSRMRVISAQNRYGSYLYHRCGAYRDGWNARGCDGARTISWKRVRDEALHQIKAVVNGGIADPDAVRRELSRPRDTHTAQERQRLREEVVAWEGYRERAKVGYLRGVLTDEESREERARADRELARCRVELQALPDEHEPSDRLIEPIVTLLSTNAWLELAEYEPLTFRDLLREVVQAVVIPDVQHDRICRVVWPWESLT